MIIPLEEQQKATLVVMERLTDDNLHTEAYIVGCSYLTKAGASEEDLKTILSRFEDIKSSHLLEGHLTGEQSKKRYETYRELMLVADSTLNEPELTKFYQCF